MRKRPRDPNQLAKLIVDIATGEVEDTVSEAKRHPESVKGRAGGLRGGDVRAKSLSADQRRRIAVRAAQARWKSLKGDSTEIREPVRQQAPSESRKVPSKV